MAWSAFQLYTAYAGLYDLLIQLPVHVASDDRRCSGFLSRQPSASGLVEAAPAGRAAAGAGFGPARWRCWPLLLRRHFGVAHDRLASPDGPWCTGSWMQQVVEGPGVGGGGKSGRRNQASQRRTRCERRSGIVDDLRRRPGQPARSGPPALRAGRSAGRAASTARSPPSPAPAGRASPLRERHPGGRPGVRAASAWALAVSRSHPRPCRPHVCGGPHLPRRRPRVGPAVVGGDSRRGCGVAARPRWGGAGRRAAAELGRSSPARAVEIGDGVGSWAAPRRRMRASSRAVAAFRWTRTQRRSADGMAAPPPPRVGTSGRQRVTHVLTRSPWRAASSACSR